MYIYIYIYTYIDIYIYICTHTHTRRAIARLGRGSCAVDVEAERVYRMSMPMQYSMAQYGIVNYSII